MKGTFALALTLVVATSACAAPPSAAPTKAPLQTREIAPKDTDAAIDAGLDVHYVVFDPGAPARGRLFFFLTGAAAAPTGPSERGSTRLITQTAAAMGFHAVNLSYGTKEAPAEACRKDGLCEERHHLAALYGGAPGAPIATVTGANSIVSRLGHLLQYLSRTYPTEGWAAYLNGDEPKWSSIVGAGWSLGGGHVAMLARDHELARVVLFEAPVDGLEFAAKPSPWIAAPHRTPADRYYTFAHLQSPLTLAGFESAWQAMGISAFGPTLKVDGATLAGAKTHQFVTDAPPVSLLRPGAFHASVVADDATPKSPDGLPRHGGVWRYLIGEP